MEILAGDKPRTQKVKVTTTNAKLTKEDAIKSLGKKAQRYVVHTWEAEGSS